MSKTAAALILLAVALATGALGAIYVPAGALFLALVCGGLGYGVWRSDRPETDSG